MAILLNSLRANNTSQHSVHTATLFLVFFLCGIATLFPTMVGAQTSMTLTVTPPLFQLSLNPGESWTSGIQVVNSNPYDITVYAQPVRFTQQSEEGKPKFYPPSSSTTANTLVSWITVPQSAITIPREQAKVIPLSITVPHDAPPGGHYAAIFIGNHAPQNTGGESALGVESSIASLIFLRVSGDVVEKGRIREFSTDKVVYSDARVRFTLRFENQGNVHLQPQGNITIYNMFGKKRGYIPINQNRDYGNVLPNSIREYTYMWEGDTGSWDIGRYRAEVTLGFGSDEKQFAHALVSFYVLPLVPLAQVLIGSIIVVWFVGWALRVYVQHAISTASRGSVTQQPREDDAHHANTPPETRVFEKHSEEISLQKKDVRVSISTFMQPLRKSILDLRQEQVPTQESIKQSSFHPTSSERKAHTSVRFKTLILFTALGAIIGAGLYFFFKDVLTYERVYRATMERPDGSEVLLHE